ncbi:ragulator complex protein LAMTOR1 isoform X4 [Parus major]|nr:ragulator complex protein LAMTOR1 isoform X4 [Parus major]XP_033374298.1 ragulator complex protein LAMTOR1 isoform X4 [Parus major]XP_033374301.1 ragulator complex protein LAMTOR1 isoform X4 [Parus major]
MLSSILAKTAINIIDVSAADSQGMEQHEYMDRARQYSTRLAMLSNNLTHWKKLPLLPSLTNQPHQVLASDPVPFADLQQIKPRSSKCLSPLFSVGHSMDVMEEPCPGGGYTHLSVPCHLFDHVPQGQEDKGTGNV